MPCKVQGQTTRTRAFSAMVRMAESDFGRDRLREPECVFEGGAGRKRTFYANVAKRWSYQDND